MCKTNVEKTQKTYLQVITDVYVRIAVLEICFEKKYNESVVETFNFAGFC